jgi:deoxyribodipyrimidine photo-lyase
MENKAIFWFRKDLRLFDNLALFWATQSLKPLIFLYIFDDTQKNWPMGAASRFWLHESLKALEESLEKYQVKICFKKGPSLDILKEISKKTKAGQIYFNRVFEPYERELENKIEKEFETFAFNSSLLRDPWDYHNQKGGPFKVFTPFWRFCQKAEVREVVLKPKKINFLNIPGLKLEELKLLPKINWYKKFNFTPGEKGAQDKLLEFKKNKLKSYKNLRDFPYLDHTSKLSPYLHFGEISPVQIWHEIYNPKDEDATCFLKELCWREFSYHLLYYFPNLPDKPFKEKFLFTWRKNQDFIKLWQKGQTGIPIVDAGMLELWHTGYMHNRVRMITASFLTKNLWQPWQEGEAWFFDTLLDADLANNSASWQWVFGSGADAAPYFRIFNPILQGKKFDPEGIYVKTWLKILKDVPKKYIHAPWEAPGEVLKKAQVTLGENYPYPIVDLAKSRKLALLEFKKIN